MQQTITSRENWLRFLRGETPQWMPLVSEVQFIHPAIVPDNMARGAVMENQKVSHDQFGGPDMYGVQWVYDPVVGGSMEAPAVPPILKAIEDWPDVIHFPDIDSWDWEGAAARNRDYLSPDRLRSTTIFTGIFERLISFMGFEEAAMTLIDEDYAEELGELLTKLTDTNIKLIEKMKQYFDVDLVCFHDDWGGQLSPFFSLQTCREVLVPHLKRVVDYCHSHGILLELHSCGHNDALVPAMVEAGVDAWCGQPMCDKFALWEQYGEKLAIGINFSSGDPQTVEDEVQQIIQRVRPGTPQKRMYIRDRANGKTLDIGDFLREKTSVLYRREGQRTGCAN